jgi:hypothetical protein
LDLPVPLNRLVDFNALLTHSDAPYRASNSGYDERVTDQFVSASVYFAGERGDLPDTFPQLDVVEGAVRPAAGPRPATKEAANEMQIAYEMQSQFNAANSALSGFTMPNIL